MTDDQFERIKKGLNFHSEGGVYNLCTLTETTLRTIIEDAVKFYEKQQKIDAEQIRALQKQNGELTDENERLKGDLELWESGACRATNLDKCGVVKELEAQIERMKCCEICSHNRGGCSYHHNWTKDCLENNHKYFELRR